MTGGGGGPIIIKFLTENPQISSRVTTEEKTELECLLNNLGPVCNRTEAATIAHIVYEVCRRP